MKKGAAFILLILAAKQLPVHLIHATLDTKDAAGISLAEVIKDIGGDVNNLSKDAIAKEDWLGYFEIHIEQGPVLYEKNIPVGVVTAIAGQCRVRNGV